MRLPRWLVAAVFALISAAVVAAVSGWWLMWPIQTARNFANRLAAGDQDSLRAIFPEFDWLKKQTSFYRTYQNSDEVCLLSRSPMDLIHGRVRFRLSGVSACFTAERSRVQVAHPERFRGILELESVVSGYPKATDRLNKLRAISLEELEKHRQLVNEDNTGVDATDLEIARVESQFERQFAAIRATFDKAKASLADAIDSDEGRD